jgi:beta-glucosidase
MTEPVFEPGHDDRPGRLSGLLNTLSLEEKVSLLTGADFWSLPGHAGIGLRPVLTSDGPAGVRGQRWDERDTALNVPAPVALAATWDPRRAELIGSLLAAECRRQNVDVLLAPTVNLQRSPLGGRNFEFLGEDPLLTAVMGGAMVRGLQQAGVAATIKHFVANDSETQRFTVDARVGERALRELYLAPFETIVREARPWVVMAAYNSVNGHTMTESPMLTGILKGEWGFDGVVVSDWRATRTLAAASAGLDLVMPGPAGPWGPGLASAVRQGLVSEAAVDDKVLRILRLAARVGALSHGAHDTVTAAPERLPGPHRPGGPARTGVPTQSAEPWTSERVRDVLRSTAAAGFVLTRNERSLLPLNPRSLRRIAVLGPNAAVPRTLGGGSATVFPPYRVSPLDGLRAALEPDVTVSYSPGVRSHTRIPLARPSLLHLPGSSDQGVLVEFLAGDGTVLGTDRRAGGFCTWRGLPETLQQQLATVRVTTAVRAAATGTHAIGCSGRGRFRLTLAGQLAFDTYLSLPAGTDPTEAHIRPPQQSAAVSLRAGQCVDVILEHRPGGPGNQTSFSLGGISFQLNIEEPYLPDDKEIARAVRLAETADVAVVVVGTTEEVESEGFDRASLDLPGRQDELVRRVAAANPRTVVVVNTGAPVLLRWAEAVPAVLLTLFPGQEYGNALADVLLGRAEPGGRLPVTWPDSADGLPATTPDSGVLAYGEGLFIGYRQFDRDERVPRYPFGHGLGYTQWEYLGAEAAASPADNGEAGPASAGTVVGGRGFAVRVRLRNAGARAGCETVQVYASRPGSAVERPVRWLAGFASAEAPARAGVTAEITIPIRCLAHWDTVTGSWAVEPGEFQLWIGRSSRDLPLTVTVTVSPGASVPGGGQRPGPGPRDLARPLPEPN